MGKPKRDQASPPRVRQLGPAAQDPIDLILDLARVVVPGLILVRWLIPTESAADGDTLWLVALWLAAAVLWAWGNLRSGEFALRWTALDFALWTVIAGHLISMAAVFVLGGDRRAAVNVAWEWIGLGAAFFLLRQVLVQAADARRMMIAFTALGVVLAGLGIWQHYVFYPQAARDYRETITQLETLQKRPEANAERIRDLEVKLQAQGVPSDERGRQQYENRLRFSSEPFGPFALANTFAGFLIVCLLIAAELFRTSAQKRPRWLLCVWVLLFGIEAFCLVLTKSRTAFAGVVAALLCWGTLLLRTGDRQLKRRTILVALSVLGGVIVLFVVATLSRGFDIQVISEAPKSLEYRLEYWKATLRLLRSHPIFGAGPGNFRHRYLAYKLPESSEEIADPHDMFLDLWSSGGMLALLGLVACLVCLWLQRRSGRAADGDRIRESEPEPKTVADPTLLAGAIGFLLAFAAPFVSGTGAFESGPIVLLLAWVAAFGLLSRSQVVMAAKRAALGGAALGLFVHLCGAGGIEMPAVVQLFLMLAALSSALSRDVRVTASRAGVLGVVGVSVALLVACLLTGVLPVLNRRALVASGEEILLRQGNPARAIQDFLSASERDPLSAEPLAEASEAYFLRWKSTASGSSNDFANAEEALTLAIRRDPYNPAFYRRVGEMYYARFIRANDQSDARRAAEEFSRAAALYPNDSSLRAKQATALAAAGQIDESQSVARRALELDAIARQHGHSDRYLAEATISALNRIATPGRSDGAR